MRGWALTTEPQTEGRVLVIDDDDIVVAALEDILERGGFAVTTRNSPIGVTKVILDMRIDIIVLDVNMPVMRGDNVVRLLQSWDKLREVPVVIVSGLEDDTLDAIREDLPDSPVVRKDAMHTMLVPTVRMLYKTRVKAMRRARSPNDAVRIAAAFRQHLSETMTAYRASWISYAAGQRRDLRDQAAGLKGLTQQAQLIGLDDIAQVLSYLHDTTQSVIRTSVTNAAVNHAVMTTVGALQDASAHPEGKMPASARALMSGLSRASG